MTTPLAKTMLLVIFLLYVTAERVPHVAKELGMIIQPTQDFAACKYTDTVYSMHMST